MGQTTHPTVTLDIGTLTGKTETVDTGVVVHTIKEFLGIPFAQPPVGDLRFKQPEVVKDLGMSPYNATYYRPFCPQMMAFLSSEGNQDEDCLYLNVFLPETPPDSINGHAVMIWIHGGGFLIGSSNEYHGAYLAAVGNVIVVTINYRLGILGFLSTMDDNCIGNYGLHDQALAFQWVHENIGSFGGDSGRVTIFGESAGSMSVGFQGLYDKNHGKIHRIIAESGSVLRNDRGFANDRLPSAQFIASHLNCPTDDTYLMVDCLKQLSWTDIKNKIIELSYDPSNAASIEYLPRVDGDIIKEEPMLYLDMIPDRVPDPVSFFRSLDFMSGINALEGGLFLGFIARDVNNFQPTNDFWESDSILTMNFGEQTYSDAVKKTFAHEYTNWSDPLSYESIRVQVAKALGDLSFVVPTKLSAELHVSDMASGSTYMYHFLPVPSKRSPMTPNWLPGADHMEEIPFIFGRNVIDMEPWEKVLSDRMITYWTNFAKSG